jgi:glycerol-3-phosphate dehydrogenase
MARSVFAAPALGQRPDIEHSRVYADAHEAFGIGATSPQLGRALHSERLRHLDPVALVQTLRADAEAAGAAFAFNNRVIDIDDDSTSYLVTTDRKTFRASCLINAAGLYADDIASLALHKRKYTVYPLRGEYTK